MVMPIHHLVIERDSNLLTPNIFVIIFSHLLWDSNIKTKIKHKTCFIYFADSWKFC